MKVPKRVNRAWFVKRHACGSGVDNLFIVFNTKTIAVTKKNILYATERNMDIEWFISHILTSAEWDKFCTRRSRIYDKYLENDHEEWSDYRHKLALLICRFLGFK